MKWSPPRIGHRKMFSAVALRPQDALYGLFAVSVFVSGCASLPAMSSPQVDLAVIAPAARVPYTADEIARMAAMPAVPVFDLEKPAAAIAASVTTEAAVASLPTTLPSPDDSAVVKEELAKVMDVPKPLDPSPTLPRSTETSISKPIVAAVDVPQTEDKKPQAEAMKSDSITPDAKSPEVAKAAVDATKPEPVAPKVEVALGGGSNKNSNARSDAGLSNAGQKKTSTETPRVAKSKPSGVLVKPPESFAWKKSGKSTGGRSFQTSHLGDEGYRTLVVGSVGGHDPLALELVDRLARHLHEDSLILGGFDSTVIRTINPDGEANRKFVNEKGEYVNGGFPKSLTNASKVQMAEAQFLLDQIDRLKPQRIVHIRSIEGGTGVVATGFSSQTAAREASEWLKFKMLMLPERGNPGSLERFVSTTGLSDMITIGIPDTTPKDEVWSLYGDTILNLLLAEDFASREIARKQ